MTDFFFLIYQSVSATLKLPIYTKEFLKAEGFRGAVYFSVVTYKGLEKPPPFKSTESHSPRKYWIFFPPEALNYSSLTFPVS